jgi:aminoglycoside phosphotransferase (APT) family kinase protein
VPAQDARVLLSACLPVRSITPLGDGLDHHAYTVNGELVARLASGPGAAEAVRRDAAILAVLPEFVTLPTPKPVLARPEHGLLVYRLLPGIPLLAQPGRDRHASALGHFLTSLHTAPTQRMAELAGVDDTSPQEWLAETRILTEQLPFDVRRLAEAFLATEPPEPATELSFTHNDLGAEHILTDGDTITGVIDWSDCAVADPAVDLGRLIRDLGVATLDTLRPGLDERTRERAVFNARCTTLEDLAFGLETGRDDYTRNAYRALAHPLF